MEQPARKNGFDRPFHPFQIISWFLQIFNTACIFCITAPCLEPNARAPMMSIFIVLQISLVYFGFKLSKSDPTDRIVTSFHNSDKL
jgi:hypothetical protein